MPKNIVWLASYPKSGNTWLRLFIFNYLVNADKPAPINQAHRLGPSDATAKLYQSVLGPGFDPTDQKSALNGRETVLRSIADKPVDVNFVKTHSVNDLAHGVRLIPHEHTRSAIYIIRNPLDMAVSYAHHYSVPLDEIASVIGSPDNVVMPEATVVHQYLGGWSGHVQSWERARGFKTKVVRYEDMSEQPKEAFGDVLKFIGAPVDAARLDKAIRFSAFKEVQKQETEHGFIEKPETSERFFRSGKIGEGRATLPQSAIDQIIADHGPMMKKYGYLE